MKVRNGFVSNSSSSSFICEVSGGFESGWDLGLSDVNMSECENGHIFYDEYIIGEVDESDEYPFNIPSKYCPICTLNKISKTSVLKYIVKMNGLDIKTIENDIRNKFNNNKEFQEFLKK